MTQARRASRFGRRGRGPKVLSAGLLVLGGLFPSFADAHPWSLFGFGPRAKGLAGAQTAASIDFSAVHYNPSSLTEVPYSGFGFTGSYVLPDLNIEFAEPQSADLALEPEEAPGVAFGAQFLLGDPDVAGRVGLGLGIHLPTGSLLSGQALDPETPQWYLYQSLPRRIVASLGFGWAPWEWVSIGAAIQILAGLKGRIEYELDIVAGRFVQKSVVFDIEPRSAPSFGIELRPHERLRLGATYRASIDAEVDLPVDLEVTGLATILVTTQFRIQYMPHEVAVGASYRVPEIETLLSVDAVWQGWSDAPDPSPQSAVDAAGGLLEGTGLDGAFDAPAAGQSRSVDLGFRDIVVISAGAEQPIGPGWLRVGYQLSPTPAPVQTTGSNHIDGTAHVFALGGGIRFRDPVGILESPLIVDASAALKFLPTREHAKIAGDDPIGDFKAGGHVLSFGLGFRYEFDAGPTK